MLYRVVTRCFWNKRVWDVDVEYDIDPSLNPPKHFVPVTQMPKPPEKLLYDPMSPTAIRHGAPVITNTGFAAKLDNSTQSLVQTMPEVKRRGRPRKS